MPSLLLHELRSITPDMLRPGDSVYIPGRGGGYVPELTIKERILDYSACKGLHFRTTGKQQVCYMYCSKVLVL
jgi:hypothetical protein